jgi:hypothetical protein
LLLAVRCPQHGNGFACNASGMIASKSPPAEDTTMFFVPIPIRLKSMTRSLEQELSLCHLLLWILVEHLGRKLTPEEKDTPLARVLAADDPAHVGRVVSDIDRHIRAGRKDLALRLLHDETAIAWDNLYDHFESWQSWDAAHKTGWLRLARLRTVLASLHKNAHPSSDGERRQ